VRVAWRHYPDPPRTRAPPSLPSLVSGVAVTPTLFIGRERYSGELTPAAVSGLINAALWRVHKRARKFARESP
jgi:hypothetical protein